MRRPGESDYEFEQRIRRESNSSRSDSGSFLLSAAVGAVTGSAILGGLIGGDIVGGIAGDLLDGDLFD